jgi:EmrB/QacA subfamily drug resistance transporter
VTGAPELRLDSGPGRGVLAAAVLASGVAFLDGTVVNAALPSIARDLDASLADLQWVITAYLLTLGAFLVLGGSLGDHFGRRRILVYGLCGFAATSALCALAPNTGMLIGARALQGVAAALMVPGSLAIVQASFRAVDRGRAIGAWSGLAGVSVALGPFLGGWLIDVASWRFVFLINVPLVAVAVFLALRFVPETHDPAAPAHIDWLGGAVLVAGLGAGVFALIQGPGDDWSTSTIVLGLVGVLALVLFVVVERRVPNPMVPLSMFRSRQFSGANAVTLLVYAALSGVLFLLVVHLQTDLGYSALEAGAAFLPATACMLVLSPRTGALSQRIGPRVPMTIGPLVAGSGMALLARVEPGSSYWTAVLPGVFVLGIGLSITVAPLTTAVLAAAGDEHAGIGSAINNAVSRVAGLVSIAILPTAAGLTTSASLDLVHGFDTAMIICGVTCALGGVVGAACIRKGTPTRVVVRADVSIPCPPCLADEEPSVDAA